MVRPIMKDVFFLSQKAEPATKADLSLGKDLMDTLSAHREECVGMAANMDRCQKECDHCQHGLYGCSNV